MYGIDSYHFHWDSKFRTSIVMQEVIYICWFLDQPFKPFLSKFSTQDEGEQVLDSLYEFRTPRNAILVIASEFISTSKKRIQKMNEKNPAQIPNLALDYESIQVR